MKTISRISTQFISLCLILFSGAILQAQTSFNISNKTNGDTLLTIDNAGNVGIGTTSPGSSIDIKSSTVDAASSFYLGNLDGSRFLRFTSGSASFNPLIRWHEGEALRFASWTDTFSELMRIAANGNLGIGTADPTSRLDIGMTGNGAWQRAIRVLNPDMVTDDGLFLVLGKSDDDRNMGYMDFKFTADASDLNRLSFGLWGVNHVLNITGAGNVGIGTTAPTEMLEVADTIYSTIGGFKFPDGTVQETAVIGGGAASIDELTDGISDGSSVFLGTAAGQNDDGNGNRNTATGAIALNLNTSGSTNTANGFGALFENTTGNNNVGVGYLANYYNQNGSQNTIIGNQAGHGVSSHDKSGSVFLGYQAGYNEAADNKLYIENSNSSTPLIWGDFAADSMRINGDLHVTGDIHVDGTGLGVSEIDDLSDGISDGSSVFLGFGTGVMDDGTNNRNTATGVFALRFNTTGYSNTANGYSSLYNNSSGYFNTATGFNALFDNLTGNSNTANGYGALGSNMGGDANVANGIYALSSNTSGSFNVGLGAQANFYNQGGSNNTIIGYQAGRGSSPHTKSGNVFLGYQAGYNEPQGNKLYIENSTSSTPLIWGDFNTDSIRIHGNLHVTGNIHGDGLGIISSIDDLTDGKANFSSVYLGENAGTNDVGNFNENTGIGISALQFNTGIRNTANGYAALLTNSTGQDNTAIGHLTLYANSTGAGNTATGGSAMSSNQSGIRNTAIGGGALRRNTTGSDNVGLGWQANSYNQQGSYNTILGYEAGRGTATHNKSGNVFIGYQAGYNETGDDKLYIENSNSSSPLIYGEFDNDLVMINGGVSLNGTFGVETIPIEGSGSRLMWYPGKAAFRSGRVSGSQWDDSDIGDYSTAMGYNTVASGGEGTVAMGYNSVARGNGSLVAGFSNTVNGSYSVAAGRFCTTDQAHSTAWGSHAKAHHTASMVFAANSSGVLSDSVYSGGAEQMVFRADGGTYFTNGGGAAPYNTSRLINTSTGAYLSSGGAWTNASSRDFKENINYLSLNEAINAVNQLNPVTYNYKTEQDENYVGFIAEDVPDITATKDRKGLSAMDIVAVLTKVVQDQQSRIEKLEQKINQMENAR